VIDELMQPAVHALVLVAQSQAGMWRRNGYSLQNQVICLLTEILIILIIIIAIIIMDNNKNVISDGSDTDNNIHSFVF